MSQENKAYIVQLVKQIVHPYFAGEIADILIAHGMTFKTEPQTNADRIRAMSDEELAKYLFDVEQGNFTIDCCDDRFCDTQNCCHNCTEAAIKWLQQPCGGADHDA